jgi:hypothetical protein
MRCTQRKELTVKTRECAFCTRYGGVLRVCLTNLAAAVKPRIEHPLDSYEDPKWAISAYFERDLPQFRLHHQTHFSPLPGVGYPRLYLDQHELLADVDQNGFHSFDHRLLQPGVCTGSLFCVTLYDYLIVADNDRHGTGTLASALPQKSQRQL